MPEAADQHVALAVHAIGAGRDESFMGRPHRVFPATLVREQVLQNNLGRTFLPADAITKDWAETANHAPVLTLHPNKRGHAVSARDPEILDKSGVGVLLRVRAENGELKGDVFIDAARAGSIPDLRAILAKLEKGEPAELSTGFPVLVEETKGAHNGREYDRVIRPRGFDHLAIFAVETGACSLKDGCGLGVNHAGDCAAQTQCADIENGSGPQSDSWIRDQFVALMRRLKLTTQHDAGAAGDPPKKGESTQEDNAMNRDEMVAQLATNGPLCKAELEKLSDDGLKAILGSIAKPATPEIAELQTRIVELRRQKEQLEADTANAREAEMKERLKLQEDLIYNGNTAFSDDQVRKMDLVTLRQLHGTVFKPRADYTGRGGPRAGNLRSFDFVKSVLGDGPSVLDKEAN